MNEEYCRLVHNTDIIIEVVNDKVCIALILIEGDIMLMVGIITVIDKRLEGLREDTGGRLTMDCKSC
ncbi:MAG: hypothetical protein AB9856_08400 [Cellulosilyticaceae bacterium]